MLLFALGEVRPKLFYGASTVPIYPGAYRSELVGHAFSLRKATLAMKSGNENQGELLPANQLTLPPLESHARAESIFREHSEFRVEPSLRDRLKASWPRHGKRWNIIESPSMAQDVQKTSRSDNCRVILIKPVDRGNRAQSPFRSRGDTCTLLRPSSSPRSWIHWINYVWNAVSRPSGWVQ